MPSRDARMFHLQETSNRACSAGSTPRPRAARPSTCDDAGPSPAPTRAPIAGSSRPPCRFWRAHQFVGVTVPTRIFAREFLVAVDPVDIPAHVRQISAGRRCHGDQYCAAANLCGSRDRLFATPGDVGLLALGLACGFQSGLASHAQHAAVAERRKATAAAGTVPLPHASVRLVRTASAISYLEVIR